MTPTPGLPDRDALARYADLGVQRLVLLPLVRSEADLLAFIERAAALV